VKKREEHKIMIIGLPSGSTSADLTKLVKPFGNPLSANVAVDADGKDRGFGFIQFGDGTAQAAAIAGLDKKDFGGRTLNVRAVEERAASTAKVSASRSRPCFDFSKGKCTKGAACKWAHVAPPTAQDGGGESSRRPEWQKKRPAGTGAQALDSVPEDVCRKYQLGSCHRGAACRWKHVICKVADVRSGAEGLAVPAAAESAKRARLSESGGAASKAACTAGGGAATSGMPVLVGGAAHTTVEELRDKLKAREASWRKANKAHPKAEPVPDEVKNRDVVWRALERMLQRREREGESTADAS